METQWQASLNDTKQTGQGLSSLAQWLRYLGTVALLVAAGTFLFQQWEGLSHLMRYGIFLSFTLLLTTIGFLIGVAMKEGKGARTFLGIAAAFIPANFCVLGGFVYSRFITHAEVQSYPEYFRWVASSDAEAIAISILAASLLALVAHMAFKVLARHFSARLTAFYILSNVILLLPFRSAAVIGLISGLLLAAAFVFDRAVILKSEAMKTREGYLARGLLVLPYIAITIRTAALYNITCIFWACVCFTMAFLIFQGARYLKEEGEFAQSIQGLSVLPLFVGWFLACDAFEVSLRQLGYAAILVQGLPLSFVLYAMSRGSLGSGRAYVQSAVLTATYFFIATAVSTQAWPASVLTILGGIGLITFGKLKETRLAVFSGAGVFVIGLLAYLAQIFKGLQVAPWMTLAFVGVVIVIISSLVEKRRLGTLKEPATHQQ